MEEGNIYAALHQRSLGKYKITAANFSKEILNSMDCAYHDIASLIEKLKTAVKVRSWTQIEHCVDRLITKILDNHNPETLFRVTPLKKQERQAFVDLGGMACLLKLLEHPLSHTDARQIPSSQIQRHVEVWNEALVLMREICFANPPVANTIFQQQHITFLFTLLSHDFVFENTMNLLEEILAVRMDAYCLEDIPDLYSLLDKFSTRRLAHLCRVFALVLFEPEDRQIMESSQVLKSYELLQLRKDRMVKGSSSAAIEKNQNLIIDMPHLLERLVYLLKLANHGPTLSDLVRQNVPMPSAVTTEFFMFMSSNRSQGEWEHYASLERVVGGGAAQVQGRTVPPQVPFRDRRVHETVVVQGSPARRSASNISVEAAEGTAVPSALSSSGVRAASTLLTGNDSEAVAGLGQGIILDDLCIDDGSSDDGSSDLDGGGIDAYEQLGNTARTGAGDDVPHHGGARAFDFGRNGMEEALMSMMRGMGAASYSPSQALTELQFQAVMLAPHQVELLFVLCTLLSGRRKMDVQQKFASLGLGDILCNMYSRLSWDDPPYEGPNPMEHIHGPNCECNPESALRVQYLRLVHNFFDRDFHNNPIKIHLLSRAEKRLLKFRKELSLKGDDSFASAYADLDRSIRALPPHQTGLLRKIMHTLTKEPVDSMYRFWLSSCLEAFLRGAGRNEQLFVTSSGVLEHLIRHVCSHAERKTAGVVSNIQTSFDLLGEIVKYDEDTVAIMEKFLISEDLFDRFMDVAMEHVVDSNVFLRSLFVTMYTVSERFRVIRGKASAGSGDMYPMRRFQRSLPPSCSTRRVKYDSIATDIAPPLSLAFASLTYEEDDEDDAIISDPLCLDDVPAEHTSPSFGCHDVVEVGYLSHSWLQFAPSILSEEAMRVADEHNRASPSHRARRASFSDTAVRDGDAVNGKRDRSGSTAKSLSFSGIRDVIQNIRRLTNSFLSRDNAPSTMGVVVSAPTLLDSDRVLNQADAAREMSLDDLQLCDTVSSSRTDTSHASRTLREGDGAASSASESTRAGAWYGADMEGTYRHEWTLPAEIRSVSSYLQQHEENILYELMTSVTVRSITHENVCCVNTALLILIFAYRRGKLPQLLHGVRYLARSRNPTGVEWLDKLARAQHESSKSSVRTNKESTSGGSKAKPGIPQWRKAWAVEGAVPPSPAVDLDRAPHVKDMTHPDSLVFVNFRELLWYWSEYYLRRGRDRLSLEFSTHAPFRHWKFVAEILCKDDGSEHSLLQYPTDLPASPYVDDCYFTFPIRYHI